MIIENNVPIREFQYDEVNKELNVTFTNNKKFSYKDVSKDVINDLETANSMEHFYEDKIKRQFEAVKVSDADQLLKS